MATQLLITLALSLLCAAAGNHFGQAVETLAAGASDPVALVSAVTRAWEPALGHMLSAPLGLSASSAPMIFALLAFIVPWVVWLMLSETLNGGDRAGEEHGSTKAAEKKELRKFATAKNPDPDNVLILSESYGLAVSRLGFDMEHDRNLNVCVIGGSGAGKTRYFVKPNLMQCFGNYFVTDPKFTLPDECLQMLTEEGYGYAIFNTNITKRSFTYNPFAYLHTDLEVLEWVDGFLAMTKDQQKSGGDQFWDDSTRLLLCALILYLRDWAAPDDYHLGGVLNLLGMADARENDESYQSPLDKLFLAIETGYEVDGENPRPSADVSGTGPARLVREDAPPAQGPGKPNMARNNTTGFCPGIERWDGKKMRRGTLSDMEDQSLYYYKQFKKAAGKTLKSILISVAVKFNAIVTRDVQALVCGPDQMHLDWLADPDKKYVIFDAFKDTNTRTLGFLHGMLVWQTISVLCKTADENGGRLQRPVQLILDEFKTLNLPKDVADMISVIRSRNVGMCIILQSLEQLYQMYDEHCANGLVGCCDTMLYLGGGDNATNKQISDSLGQQTVRSKTSSVSHQGAGHGSWSESEQVFGRAFLDQAEVGRIRKHDCIVQIKGTDPAVDKKYYLYDHRRAASIDPGHRRPWKGPWKRDLELVDETRLPGKLVLLLADHLPAGLLKGPAAKYGAPIDLKAFFDEKHERDRLEAEERRRRQEEEEREREMAKKVKERRRRERLAQVEAYRAQSKALREQEAARARQAAGQGADTPPIEPGAEASAVAPVPERVGIPEPPSPAAPQEAPHPTAEREEDSPTPSPEAPPEQDGATQAATAEPPAPANKPQVDGHSASSQEEHRRNPRRVAD